MNKRASQRPKKSHVKDMMHFLPFMRIVSIRFYLSVFQLTKLVYDLPESTDLSLPNLPRYASPPDTPSISLYSCTRVWWLQVLCLVVQEVQFATHNIPHHITYNNPPEAAGCVKQRLNLYMLGIITKIQY